MVMLHLLIVVDIADDAEYQGEYIDIQVGEVPLQHAPPAQDQNGDADADDEHQAAHGGSALFALVPGGANLLDALPGLQPDQGGDQQLTGCQGDRQAYDACQNNFHHVLSFPSRGDVVSFRLYIPQ